MRVVAFKSLFGGAGATTVMANISTALQRQHHVVVAVDLCSTNVLRLHFGMPLKQDGGLFTQHSSAVSDLRHAAFENSDGVIYIPYGQPSHDQADEINTAQLEGFYQELETLCKGKSAWLILNLPTTLTPLAMWWLAKADLLIHVLTPEPRAYPALQQFIQHSDLDEVEVSSFFLFNQVATHLELNRDIFDLLNFELQAELIIPTAVQRDQHVPEALATQQSVFSYAAGAQANIEITAVTHWLTEYPWKAQHAYR